MGMLMIRCPRTGLTISTGWSVEVAAFRSSPVFFSRTYCSHCCTAHEWFAKDAWICDDPGAESEPACEWRAA